MAKLVLRYNMFNLPDTEYEETESNELTKKKVDFARELFDKGMNIGSIVVKLEVSDEKRAKELISGINHKSHKNGYKIIAGKGR